MTDVFSDGNTRVSWVPTIANLPGRGKFDNNALRLKKQNANPSTDAIFNLLTYNTSGYVVIRKSVDAATAWTSGQLCQVYPATTGYEKYLAPEANTVERYEVPIFVNSQPQLRAVVA
jgi:hypothetical protein